MIRRRRRHGWGEVRHDDRALHLAMLAGGLGGGVVGVVTLNLGWVAGRLVDLSQILGVAR